ncbi:hypothetical protein CDAR_588301 [Caerostris darwini]|uniref:Uncharacterized protein n=1 Tax=Caerostris darwini TaxID=1538125 RepID=A0AAV4S9W9_9ARAC|nr:hypothetical protein CDAR_588301 [Caerostris darwini]
MTVCNPRINLEKNQEQSAPFSNNFLSCLSCPHYRISVTVLAAELSDCKRMKSPFVATHSFIRRQTIYYEGLIRRPMREIIELAISHRPSFHAVHLKRMLTSFPVLGRLRGRTFITNGLTTVIRVGAEEWMSVIKNA